MAHLLVSRETVVGQENPVQGRGKLKRSPSDVSSALVASASKRRALATITNRPLSRECQATKPTTTTNQLIMPPLQTTLDQLFLPTSSFLFCSEIEAVTSIGFQPTTRGVNTSTCSTGNSTTGSFCLPTGCRSFGSPDSPMMLSSPDVRNTSLMCTEVIDIDLLENNNCAVCGDYAKDIFTYLREAEIRFQPKPGYMSKQPDITAVMRTILVDWLVEVADEFKLDPHTFFLAISITDRFLSSMSVMRSKLQLVGTASMYLASKFEEIYPPEIGDFSFITDDTYSKIQIVRMERLILKALDFNLTAPTTYTFLLRFLKAAEAEQLQTTSPVESVDLLIQTIEALAKYLCELASQEADPYLKYLPSVIAASAICLARHTLGQVAWPAVVQHYSGYSVSDIGNCLQDLHRTFAMAHRSPQQAIRLKYSSEQFMKVSHLKAPETLPC